MIRIGVCKEMRRHDECKWLEFFVCKEMWRNIEGKRLQLESAMKCEEILTGDD